MRLGELIEQLHFESEVVSKTFRFRGELYKVFHVKRSEKALPGIVFSEYFFVEVSEEAMSLFDEADNLSYFRDFQSKLLSSHFFSYKNDVRWNLYLILVIDRYDIVKDSTLFQKIENDADYARKYIATPTDILKWLDKEWLHASTEDKAEHPNPLQEWTEQMESVQLTGCLTQTFSKDSVNQYMAGNPFVSEGSHSNTRRGQNYNEYEEKIEAISEVSFDGFRKHCFSEVDPFYPTGINLLHGSNGSGKTSALEAIEFALTNEIKRCSEFGDPVEETAELLKVLCKTESDKMLSFQSGKPLALYKKLAQTWYGVTSGRQSELNYYFHRFNYFDSEAAYRFALNESGRGDTEKFDYSDNLSRLVFGDSVIATQTKWQRYKQEFEDQLKSITKQQNEVSLTLEELNKQVTDMNSEREQPILLDPLLKTSNIRETEKTQKADEDTAEFLSRLINLLKSVEPIRKEISESRLSFDVLSIENIRIDLQNQKERNILLTQERNNKITIQERLSIELNRIRSEQKNQEGHCLTLRQNLISINGQLLEWNEVRKILEEPLQVESKRGLEKKIVALTNKLEQIQFWMTKYSKVPLMTISDLVVLDHVEEQEIEQVYVKKEEQLISLQKQIETIENLMGEINALISRLQHMGREYLELEENSTVCPLCKHNHDTHDALVNTIHSAISVNKQEESNIGELRKQAQLLQSELESISQKTLLQKNNKLNVEQVAEAYKDMVNSLISDVKIDLSTPEQQLQEIQVVLSTQSKCEQELVISEKQLEMLNELGFSHNLIIRAELFQNENEWYRMFVEQPASLSFEEYMITIQRGLQKDILESENSSERLRQHGDGLQEKFQQFSKKDLDTSVEENEIAIKLLQKTLENIESLLIDFDLDKNENLRVWAINLQKVHVQLELVLADYKNHQLKTELLLQQKEAFSTFEILKNKNDRCSAACTIFSHMKPLREFTEEFINRNISRIERFFKMLHTPREFDSLILEKDGLTLQRKLDGKIVKAYQMSSGQRASLALSVMFAVHLAAPSAPKFIIMDEPVANMDDLHLMNLLDLLRDLSLSGRQIFFTTANPDVANLFRRKFSFFQKQFTHFEFTRHSGEPVSIRAIQYTPHMESPLSQIG
jgi:exonuclease SbcC